MASDNFTGSNGTPLESHDSNWTSIGAPWVVTNYEIYNNLCQTEGAWQTAGCYYNGSSADNCQIVDKAHTATAKHAVVRASSGHNGYGVGLGTVSGSDWTVVDVTKDNAWLATIEFGTWATASDHTLRITATGTSSVTLEGFVDDVSLGTVVDSSDTIESGHPGFFNSESGTTANARWDDWTDGEGAIDNSGSGAIELPSTEFAGTGTSTPPTFSGSGTIELPIIEADGAGEYQPTLFSGSGAVTLPIIEIAGEGTSVPPVFSGSGAIELPIVEADGTGESTPPVFSGSSSITLPIIEVDGEGVSEVPVFSGTGSIDLPAIEILGTGDASYTLMGSGAIDLPFIEIAGTGISIPPIFSGSGAINLPAIEFSGTNATNTVTLNLVNCKVQVLSGTPLDVAVASKSSSVSGAIVNSYLSTFDGADYDIYQDGDNELNIHGSILANNTVYGSADYRGTFVSEIGIFSTKMLSDAVGIGGVTNPLASLHVQGNAMITTIADAGDDVDKFLVADNDYNIDYRTGAEVLSDIGAEPALTKGNLTASGALSIDNTRQVIGGAAAISHSDAAGYKHVPTGGSAGQFLKYGGASGTAAWSAHGLTYSDVGAAPALSLTTGYIPYANAATTLANSVIFNDAANSLIGVGTTSPATKIHIYESDAGKNALTLERNVGTVNYNSLGTITFKGSNADIANPDRIGANISAIAEGNWSGSTNIYYAPTGICFYTQDGSDINTLSNIRLKIANTGTISITTCADAGADVDKFLVWDASGNIDYRTGAEVLSDIGAAPALSLTTNYLPKAASTTTLGNSVVFEDAATNYIGIKTTSPDRTLHVSEEDATTNATTYVLRLTHSTSGEAASGIGVGMEFEAEDLYGSMNVLATVEAVDVSPTDTTSAGELVIKTYDEAGAGLAERVRVKYDGTVKLSTCADAGDDVDKFLVLDSNGHIDYRTGTELLADILPMTTDGSSVTITRGSDDTEILVINGADVLSEYASIGISIGYAYFRGGGVGSTSTGLRLGVTNAGTPITSISIDSGGFVSLATVKSGSSQLAAGAAANEIWRTSGHATLPDNILMFGV